jgi:hypothetical protein
MNAQWPRISQALRLDVLTAASCRSSPLRIFCPIKDELAVRLEGSKACLQCSQHRYRHLGVVTFLKGICNNFALAGDAVLTLGDEPLSLV